MSNLRSDCRALVENLPPGDTYRAHILCLCAQIDQIEDHWHAAERKAKAAADEAARHRGMERAWMRQAIKEADKVRALREELAAIKGEEVAR